jgi:hypothetical protein
MKPQRTCAHKEHLVRLLTLEEGKPVPESDEECD